MLKELRKQIEQKKKELIIPIKENLEKIFTGFQIFIDFSIDGSGALATFRKQEEEKESLLSFSVEGEQMLYSSMSLQYEKEDTLIVSVKPLPFTIGLDVIQYVFYELQELLKSMVLEDTPTGDIPPAESETEEPGE